MHIMLDLETMGSTPGSIIASIGAVAFDPVTGDVGGELYQVVDIRDAQRCGLRFDADTVSWWMKQSDAARAALAAEPVRLAEACMAFSTFYRKEKGTHIWGHGGNFDEPLISSAFRAAHVVPPWKFWDARCTRTIYELAGVKPDRATGTHHNALDDARAQAKAVVIAYERLGLSKATTNAG